MPHLTRRFKPGLLLLAILFLLSPSALAVTREQATATYNQLVEAYNQHQWTQAAKLTALRNTWQPPLEPGLKLQLLRMGAYAHSAQNQHDKAYALYKEARLKAEAQHGKQSREVLELLAYENLERFQVSKAPDALEQLSNLLPRLKAVNGSPRLQQLLPTIVAEGTYSLALDALRASDFSLAYERFKQVDTVKTTLPLNLQAEIVFRLADLSFREGETTALSAYLKEMERLLAEGAPLDEAKRQRLEQVERESQTVSLAPTYTADLNPGTFRWHPETRVVRVHIENGGYLAAWRPAYVEMVKRAFSEWEALAALPFTYVYTAQPTPADIVVRWVNDPQPGDPEEHDSIRRVGTCRAEVQDGYLTGQTLTFSLHETASPEPLSEQRLYAVALHEVGHSLGMSGHSPHPQDVMYHASHASELSARDLATVQQVMRQPARATNQPGLALSDTKRYVQLIGEAAEALQAKQYTKADALLQVAGQLTSPDARHTYIQGLSAYRQAQYDTVPSLLTTLSDKRHPVYGASADELLAYSYYHLWEKESRGTWQLIRRVDEAETNYKQLGLHYTTLALNNPQLDRQSVERLKQLKDRFLKPVNSSQPSFKPLPGYLNPFSGF